MKLILTICFFFPLFAFSNQVTICNNITNQTKDYEGLILLQYQFAHSNPIARGIFGNAEGRGGQILPVKSDQPISILTYENLGVAINGHFEKWYPLPPKCFKTFLIGNNSLTIMGNITKDHQLQNLSCVYQNNVNCVS